MRTAEYLKAVVGGRLAAAAEEICAAFHRAIGEYEEELGLHRALSEVAQKRRVVTLRPASE